MGQQPYVPPDYEQATSSSQHVSGQMDQPSSTRQANRPQSSGGFGIFNTSIFSLQYYLQFFDVDSDQVLTRCIQALNPFDKRPFLSALDAEVGGDLAETPDMYGPFWICTTVVFVLFFASTLVGLLFSSWQGVKYEYKFDLLTGAAGLMYGYTVVVPTVLWLGLRYYSLGMHVGLLELICLYGYANVTWIPVAILSVSPLLGAPTISNIIRWVFIVLGFAMSGMFLVRNVHRRLGEIAPTTAKVVPGFILVAHAGLALAVKFLFFGVEVKD